MIDRPTPWLPICDRYQKGQSLVELIVASLVLVPLFVGIPLVGKYADINQKTLEAARYAAWEKTTDPDNEKSEAQIAKEVRARFFSPKGVPIKTNSGPSGTEKNAMWYNYDGAPMLPDFSDVGVAIKNDNLDGAAAAQASSMSFFFNGLKEGELYEAKVSVNLAEMNFPQLPLGGAGQSISAMNITRHNTLLTNGWNSGSDDEEKSRVDSEIAVPLSTLSNSIIDTIFEIVGSTPFEPALKQYQPRYIKPGEVPADRFPD